MKLVLQYKKLFFFLFLFSVISSFSQSNVAQGINFQGIVRNTSGTLISNQAVTVKIGIREGSVNGLLNWEETHQLTTNQFGLFQLIIGKGISTGNGSNSSFALINWAGAEHYIMSAIDPTGGNVYTLMDTTKFWSVPYAMHAIYSDQTKGMRLNDLTDVDTLGVAKGYTLKWDGTQWKPAKDIGSDTAMYGLKTLYSIHADTALYCKNSISTVDTVKFAYYSDTSKFAWNAKTALNSANAIHSDTATYALNVLNTPVGWNLSGNDGTTPGTNFIGTIDSKDLVIKTNNTERLRILANGKVGIGLANPTASFQVNGDDGILATGTFASGTGVSLGAGTRMHWYPKKAAFRAGYVSSNQWDDAKVGIYSMAGGYNNTASGAYSTAMGNACNASGANSVAMGYGCTSSLTSGISMGSSCSATGEFAVALGRGIIASDSSAIGIGYHSNASGKYSLAFGANTNASGMYSTTMGSYSNTNGKRGSFVYADNSSTNATNSTADNEFMVRASGGVIFYSNAAMTSGVFLAPGSGSWANLSDKHKKENFERVDGDRILNGIESIEITSWNYKSQSPSVRHVGPMAQDFFNAFHYGENETTITSVDIDGINLIALKTLALKTNELKKNAEEMKLLKEKIKKMEEEKFMLEKRIVSIEKQISSKQQ